MSWPSGYYAAKHAATSIGHAIGHAASSMAAASQRGDFRSNRHRRSIPYRNAYHHIDRLDLQWRSSWRLQGLGRKW